MRIHIYTIVYCISDGNRVIVDRLERLGKGTEAWEEKEGGKLGDDSTEAEKSEGILGHCKGRLIPP